MKRTVAAEQFYTPAATVTRCLELVNKYHPLAEFSLIVEPSAGAGAFLTQLPPATSQGIDLYPQHPDVTKSDFLVWPQPLTTGKVLTIGNPPFGQRGALAVQFIHKACQYSDVVAFILPRSFKKYTFQNRIPAYFHLIDSFDCEEFLTPNGSKIKVKSVFQIWERRPEPRTIHNLPTSHPDFALKHAHLAYTTPEKLAQLQHDFDFTIPQVGADFRPRDHGAVSKGSHWFIKPKNDSVRDIFEHLDFSFLDGMNTAHKSLSKRDIILAYTNAKAKLAA